MPLSPNIRGPSIDCWTLKFKHAKSTIYLHSKPDTPFATLKSDLLAALKDLAADSMTVESLPPLPQESDHIVFAIQVSTDDDDDQAEAGWVPLDIPETEVEGADGETRTVGGAGTIVNRDPQSAGLRDGSQVAFRFLTDAEIESGKVEADGKLWNVEQPQLDDPDEGDPIETDEAD